MLDPGIIRELHKAGINENALSEKEEQMISKISDGVTEMTEKRKSLKKEIDLYEPNVKNLLRIIGENRTKIYDSGFENAQIYAKYLLDKYADKKEPSIKDRYEEKLRKEKETLYAIKDIEIRPLKKQIEQMQKEIDYIRKIKGIS